KLIKKNPILSVSGEVAVFNCGCFMPQVSEIFGSALRTEGHEKRIRNYSIEAGVIMRKSMI
ncbi:jg24373, partial [Pararge aegeria aegeria]